MIIEQSLTPEQERVRRRIERDINAAEQAQYLLDSPGWAWFEEQLQLRIDALEKRLFDGIAQMSTREYDAAVGMRNGLTKALTLVTEAEKRAGLYITKNTENPE